MTIYLPESISLFRQAFDSVCQRILQCEKNAAFYELLVQLIGGVREHPLLKEQLASLEAENQKQRQQFCTKSLIAVEESWARLWKYHQKSFKSRKQLVAIKRVISSPSEISYSPLYDRLLFKLWEFCYHSSFFRCIREAPSLFRAVHSELHCAKIRADHLKKGCFIHKKIIHRKLSTRDKCKKLFKKSMRSASSVNHIPTKHSVEWLHANFFSPKVSEIKGKFFIQGHNTQEKRQNMQILAEISGAFCWERLQFLEMCYIAKGNFPILQSLKGRWPTIRQTAWRAAFERCEQEALLGASASLRNKLLRESCTSIDSLLTVQYQIHREDFEKYLSSFKNHVHSLLFRSENEHSKEIEDARFMLPGSKREDFVVQLARQFWKMHPKANRDMVYNHYSRQCPMQRLLSRESFDRIVRKHKLDPRSKREMKRGPGKKTLQI